MPAMLPRQTRRNTSFGLPMRVKVCPITTRPPLPCGKATQHLRRTCCPQIRGIGHRGLSLLANFLFSQANRTRRPSCASEPKRRESAKDWPGKAGAAAGPAAKMARPSGSRGEFSQSATQGARSRLKSRRVLAARSGARWFPSGRGIAWVRRIGPHSLGEFPPSAPASKASAAVEPEATAGMG